MNTTMHFLSAGAAQGLVKAKQEALKAQTGASAQGRFGAVGAMKEAFDAGEPCDMIILTQAMIDAMLSAGAVRREGICPLGVVRTGVAVRHGQAPVDVASPDALRAALRAADAIYFPDPLRATAGIHFASVLRTLGVYDELQPRWRTFPNGATAMREMAASPAANPIGCTQVTEIRYTDGVDLVALLPAQFELATTYTAAVAQGSVRPDLAQHFIKLIGGADSAALRLSAGFES
jgi:molybdate transport system substrate-binding protein